MFSNQTTRVRREAVAGQFYPAEAGQLSRMLDDLLSPVDCNAAGPVKAIIAPHAGYIYSGPVAASIYARLKAQAANTERVVLLGPSHHVGFQGLACSSAECFRSPLGEIPIDMRSLAEALELPQVVQLDQAHVREHSLEVQLPFLQKVLGRFKLVPFVVGDSQADEVAEVLQLLWGASETLIVVSSDLSHFLDYQTARRRDRATSDAILELAPERIAPGDACGRNPINGLLLAARAHGLQSELIDLRNSGDTAGSDERVVGYGAYAFSHNA